MVFWRKKKQPLQEKELLAALDSVHDPLQNRGLIAQEAVKDVQVNGRHVKVQLVFPRALGGAADTLRQNCEKALRDMGAKQVSVSIGVEPKQAGAVARAIPGVKAVLAVASGKGGVGKTSVATNLALALAERGLATGLLDCDIYGPNIATAFDHYQQPSLSHDRKIVPIEHGRLALMSMGFLTEPESPVVWRGPMLHKMILQFLDQVDWQARDVLVLDLPPGTGDVQLSLTQRTPLTAALLVTTPQQIAAQDAHKAASMFEQVQVPVLGLVENMAYYLCKQCDKRHNLFGHGGGQALSQALDVPLLAQLPFDPDLAGGKRGKPYLLRQQNTPLAAAYHQLAERVEAGLAALPKGTPTPQGGTRANWAKPGQGAWHV